METQSTMTMREPEIFNPADAIEYQASSVVSKQLVKKETGTVTLFAFDKGQELSEHTAPYDAMVIILDGAAEITISKKLYSLQSGNSIILPANEPHALKAVSRFKMLLIMVRS